jgi:hypothetical protein
VWEVRRRVDVRDRSDRAVGVPGLDGDAAGASDGLPFVLGPGGFPADRCTREQRAETPTPPVGQDAARTREWARSAGSPGCASAWRRFTTALDDWAMPAVPSRTAEEAALTSWPGLAAGHRAAGPAGARSAHAWRGGPVARPRWAHRHRVFAYLEVLERERVLAAGLAGGRCVRLWTSRPRRRRTKPAARDHDRTASSPVGTNPGQTEHHPDVERPRLIARRGRSTRPAVPGDRSCRLATGVVTVWSVGGRRS